MAMTTAGSMAAAQGKGAAMKKRKKKPMGMSGTKVPTKKVVALGLAEPARKKEGTKTGGAKKEPSSDVAVAPSGVKARGSMVPKQLTPATGGKGANAKGGYRKRLDGMSL